ncbi:MAG: EF-hand domain-containing protein [Hyphomicrobiales bacterium]
MNNKTIVAVSALAILMAGVAAPSLAKQHKGGKHFAKMDTDGNGTVSEAEFVNRAKARFAKIDADGNGEITKEELKAAHEARKAKRAERKAKRAKKAE